MGTVIPDGEGLSPFMAVAGAVAVVEVSEEASGRILDGAGAPAAILAGGALLPPGKVGMALPTGPHMGAPGPWILPTRSICSMTKPVP